MSERSLRLALPFLDGDEAVCRHVAHCLNGPIWPPDLNAVDGLLLLESEVQTPIVLREVASTASPLVDLDEIAGDDFDFRSVRTPVALRADKVDHEEVICVAAVVAKNRRRTIQVVDDHVDVTVVVDVSKGRAPAHGK